MDHEARVALMEAHYAYVVKLAIHFAKGYDVEDAVGDALLAVWEHTERWDESLGVFPTFIRSRIHGAVMDGRRRRGPLTRSQVERGVEYPTSLDSLREVGWDAETEESGFAELEDSLYLEDLATHVVDTLKPRLLDVLVLRVQGATCSQIGDALGVTESRASQLLKEVRRTLASHPDAEQWAA